MFRSAVFVIVLFVANCASGTREAIVEVDENGGVVATLPDGTIAASIDEYEASIANQVGPIEEMQPLALTVTAKKTDGGARGVTIGKFRINIKPNMDYLDGCIRKRFFHLMITVEAANAPAPIVELHLVAFFEGGKPCFAVMNTGFVGYGWCQKMCVANPKDGIKTALKGGMVAAGVGATTAAIFSILLAPIASAAFAI